MNRERWLREFEGYDIWLNSMLKAIPNFDRLNRKDDFVIKKSRKYYQQINTISKKIIEIDSNRCKLRISTIDMENKVRGTRELLREALEKRKIPNGWDDLLVDIERKY